LDWKKQIEPLVFLALTVELCRQDFFKPITSGDLLDSVSSIGLCAIN
jgi:hypothetical protein